MTLFFLYIGGCLALGFLAHSWGRTGVLWFVGGLLVSPILAGILLLLVGESDSQNATATGFSFSSYSKRCPDCAESVQVQARVCKHCEHEWEESEVRKHTLEMIRKADRNIFYCKNKDALVPAKGFECVACHDKIHDGQHIDAEEHLI